MQIKLKFDSRLAVRWAERFSKQRLIHAARALAPTLLALSLATAAHAQGTMDFSGAQTLMGTFKTLPRYSVRAFLYSAMIRGFSLEPASA
jgi:hypothetical protein